MLINFTEKYQFSTRLQLNNENLEMVKYAKLLGVIISDDLKWDLNTNSLVKRANARMELLRKVASFTTSIEEKKNIYILYIRSILEQSCVVWNNSLTKENRQDPERIKKVAVSIIQNKTSNNYEDALEKINLQTLEKRREDLCLKFAMKCTGNDKMKEMFPKRKKNYCMDTRNEEEFYFILD